MSLVPPTGVIILDKPKGLTSRRAAESIGRFAGANRQGHSGTLDPLATGVLVVCLDRATLLSRFLGSGTKDYQVTALLGVATDTYDTEGEIVATDDASGVGMEDLALCARRLTGEKPQVPPDYSAVKLKGRPLYEYARAGVPVEAPPRLVNVRSFDVLSVDEARGAVYARLAVTCGPGTYIRSLVNDLGRLVGCLACVSDLRRTRAGAFTVEDSVTIDELESGSRNVSDFILTMEEATAELPCVTVNSEGAKGVSQGKPLLREWIVDETPPVQLENYRVMDEQGRLLAIYGTARPEDDAGVHGRAARVIRPYNNTAVRDEAS